MSPVPLERHGQLVRETARKLLTLGTESEELRRLAAELAEDLVRAAHEEALRPDRAMSLWVELDAQARALAECARGDREGAAWEAFALVVQGFVRGVAAGVSTAIRVILFGVGG